MIIEIMCTVKVTHLSSQSHPPTLVHGKIVFYETSPWYQKDLELLLSTARGITPK